VELRPLGRTGIRVSELCLGAMTFGREADEATSASMLDRFLDAGGNFVDTADVYSDGVSEQITGRALGAKRANVVLATKVRFPTGPGPNDVGLSRRHVRLGVEASLRRLNTDWIDLYQVHCWDERTPLEETLSTLDDLVREGKVRYIGASNFAAWQLAKSIGVSALHGWEAFASLQPEYSLITRDIERELAALHPARQDLLVGAVTTDHAGSTSLERGGCGVGSSEGDDFVAPGEQVGQERRADQARPTCDEYSAHVDKRAIDDARGVSYGSREGR